MNRKKAEAHWEYTAKLMELCVSKHFEFDEMMGICEYLYIEAMLHGHKHGIQSSKSSEGSTRK
jgi:hypothetical protein